MQSYGALEAGLHILPMALVVVLAALLTAFAVLPARNRRAHEGGTETSLQMPAHELSTGQPVAAGDAREA